MRKIRRISALLLAIMMICGTLAAPVEARYVEWDTSDGSVELFICEDCEDYGEASDANVCKSCDETFCDSCFCDHCKCCNEHCSCDFRADDHLEMDDELEVPEVPSVDYSEAESALGEDLMSHMPTQDYSEYNFEVNANAAELLQNLCGYSSYNASVDMKNCVETLKRVSEVQELIHTVDSTNTFEYENTDFAKEFNYTAKFIENLSTDSSVQKFINNHFKWNAARGIYSEIMSDNGDTIVLKKLNSLTKEYLDILKKLAVSQGFDKNRLDKIAFRYTNTDALENTNLHGQWNPDLNMLDLNAYSATDGRLILRTITHEFVHALNTIEQEKSQKETVRDIRMNLNQYVYKDSTGDYWGYAAQLEERLPRVAELALGVSENETQTWEYLVNNYGYEMLPLLEEATNAKNGYGTESRLFLTEMANCDQELKMISADLDFTAVDSVSRPAVSSALSTQNYYLIRVDAANGETYILPTLELLQEVGQVEGSKMTDFLKSVYNRLSAPSWDYDYYLKLENYPALVQEAMDDPNFNRGKDQSGTDRTETYAEEKTESVLKACANRPMTADEFEFALSVASLLVMDRSFGGDAAKREKYYKLMERLLSEAEDLLTRIETLDSVESLQDDVELYADDAAYAQNELQELKNEYDGLLSEYEALSEELKDELENVRDDLIADGRNTVDDAEELLLEDKEAYIEELNDSYSDTREDFHGQLEEMAGELEDLGHELESKTDELNGIIADLDDAVEELEKAAKESEEVSEAYTEVQEDLRELSRFMSQTEGAVIDRDFDRRLKVEVTDINGNPVVGAPVYYQEPGSTAFRFAGNTDREGMLEASVSCMSNSGLTVSVGNKNSFLASDGKYYGPSACEDLCFVVYIEEDTPVYVLEAEIEVDEAAAGSVKNTNLGDLQVTIRRYETAMGKLRDYSKVVTHVYNEVSWIDYYNYMTTTGRIKVNGVPTDVSWVPYMTEEKADYYGVYLLPLSSDGQLPMTDQRVYFEPLYEYVDGERCLNLWKSWDYSTPNEETDEPFESVMFSLENVAVGRYEMVVILPDKEEKTIYSFSEVEVSPGSHYDDEETHVLVSNWNSNPTSEPAYKPSAKRASRYAEVEVYPEIWTVTEGRGLGLLDEHYTDTLFALSVDAAGNKIWSVVDYNEAGNLVVPVRTGYGDSGWNDMSPGWSLAPTYGQIYLYADCEEDFRLLPVTYVNDYKIFLSEDYETGAKRYLGSSAGEIYALAPEHFTDSKPSDPLVPVYVAFWEEYQDAEGNLHYKTVDQTVSFELHWDYGFYNTSWYDQQYDIEAYMRDTPHVTDAVSTNRVGIMTNYLNQRKLTEKGASYTFTYTAADKNIYGGREDLEDIPVYCAAERLYIEDGEDVWEGLPIETLTGTALMTLTLTEEDGTKKKASVEVEPVITQTADGIVFRFIIGDKCQGNDHDWQELSNAATCTEGGVSEYTCLRCGAKKSEETPALGHVRDEEKGYVCVSESDHAWFCGRCETEIVEKSAHRTQSTTVFAGCTETVKDMTCSDCGLMKRYTTDPESGHDVGERPRTYYNEECHWQYCVKCGQKVKTAHNLMTDEESQLTYCTDCHYVKGEEGKVTTVSMVWANSNVCCPHENLQAYFCMNKFLRFVNAAQTRVTTWEYMLDEEVKVIGTGDILNTASVKDILLKTNSGGIYGYVRPVMSWGETRLEGEWIDILPMTGVAGYDATCYGTGKKDHFVCSCGAACDIHGNLLDTTIETTEHTYDNSCDEYCNECGRPRDITHAYGTTYICENGEHYHRCTICGKKAEREECYPSDWIIEKEATCDTDGLRYKECVVCKTRMIEEAIPAGHDYAYEEDETVQGTYHQGTQRCKRCGDTEDLTGDLPVTYTRTYVPEVPATTETPGVAAHYVCVETGVISLDKKGKIVIQDAAEELELQVLSADESRDDEEPGEDDETTEPEKEEKNHGKLFLILGIIIAGLLIAAALFYFLWRKKKAVVQEASQEDTPE